MENIIRISSMASMAMTEETGMKLRREIEKSMLDSDEVTLDFSGIEFFATPFFNSSVGYYIMQWSPEEFEKKVHLINLSELGEETYKHSYQNAISVMKGKIDTDTIGKITANTIAER